MILELLASGKMSLTSVRLLSGTLTMENHEAVLARASDRSRREIEALVAELAPQPDVPSSVRKLPSALPVSPARPGFSSSSATPVQAAIAVATEPAPPVSAPPPLPTRRPIVEATSPDRYRVQFTIGKESHDKLRRLQALLRREIPDGDPAVIFDRALTMLLEKVEKQKLGARSKSAKRAPARPIRPGTDNRSTGDRPASRHIPADVQRAASERDRDQCAFVSKDGRRCTERAFLEFHHIRPYALGGQATVDNISLRCRRHNQYEAELVFGPRGTSLVRETSGLCLGRLSLMWDDVPDSLHRHSRTERGRRDPLIPAIAVAHSHVQDQRVRERDPRRIDVVLDGDPLVPFEVKRSVGRDVQRNEKAPSRCRRV